MLHLLTEEIAIDDAFVGKRPRAHFRVADSAVEEALQTALREDIPRCLEEIAKDLGYRSVAPLQNRYRELCSQVVSKRRSGLKISPIPPDKSVPRDRIEQALSEALKHDRPVSLLLCGIKGRTAEPEAFYKGFHNVRPAITAKSKRLSKQRVDTIESALRAAFNET